MKKELMYVQGSSEPTFVIIKGLNLPQTEEIEGDYIGTYNKETMLCTGRRIIDNLDNQLVECWGDDFTTEKVENVEYSQPFGIFYYDSKVDKFYDITGNVKSAISKKEAELKWYPLNLLYLENPVVKEEIELLYDEDLVNTSLTVEIVNDEKSLPNETLNTDPIWLKIRSTNVKNIMVIPNWANGKLEQVDRWIQGTKVSYKYTPSDKDTNVKFTVVAQNIFDNSFIQKDVILKVNQLEKPEEPNVEEDEVIYEEEAFKVVIKDDVRIGKWYYIEPITKESINIRLMVEKPNGGKTYNIPNVKSNYRGFPLTMVNKLYLFDVKIGNNYNRYNPSKLIWTND